ncbi:MAG TPA: cobyrinate a,c-diamide synthase [Nitrososphaerales archaeon]|nr:cobyrinate a,c-diamide synthase [Nitrososphaerales archaeon]
MIPRLVIAGVTSGVGKTSISMALMNVLREKGYKVQGFKVGPDYIDPSYHTTVTGRQSRNLDPWLMGEKGLLTSFNNASKDADFAVIEGVMGLFDGFSGSSNFASTAHIAKLLKSPVILVMDVAKAARSVAAVALGFTKFDTGIKIAGLILNNVAGEKHAKYCIDAIKQKVKVPVLGTIRRNKEFELQERHLGLVPTSERKELEKKILAVANYIKEQIDVDKVVSIARKVPLLHIKSNGIAKNIKATIAVALDESFNFYYADNFDTLRSLGAELKFFSPVNDESIPDADGLFLGGGFPEVLADRLEKNSGMLLSIKNAARNGMPIYAECGGLMYLTKSITEFDGKKHGMVDLFDVDTIMDKKLTLSYTEAKIVDTCLVAKTSRTIRGHEFHYSKIDNVRKDTRFAYKLSKGKGINGSMDGLMEYNTLASYMHLHFANKSLAENFLLNCKQYSKR